LEEWKEGRLEEGKRDGRMEGWKREEWNLFFHFFIDLGG